MKTLITYLCILVAVACLNSCSDASESEVQVQSEQLIIELNNVPEEWKILVLDAIDGLSLANETRYSIIVEKNEDWHFLGHIEFNLYEDGPDMVHRIDTYRLTRTGKLYVMNLFADDLDDVWRPIQVCSGPADCEP